MSPPITLSEYAARRDAWLQHTAHALQRDPRFVAAWLAGSFGRGTADAVSDLDLHLVVTDAAAGDLLRKPEQIWADTTPERRALFAQFGTPAIVHENHGNAICGGTFTYLEYADLVKVDWQLIAHSRVVRPRDTRLVFANSDIPIEAAPQPESPAARRADLAEQTGYFWLMLATACKYLIRGDAVALIKQLDMVHGTLDGIERLLRGKPAVWGENVLPPFHVTSLEHKAVVNIIDGLAQHMCGLYPEIERIVGAPVHPAPMAQIDALLAIAASTQT